MRAAWVTDIHLDFLSHAECEEFFASIVWESPDDIFLTGDISVAPLLLTHLDAMNQALSTPIYFVLGNHDFYRGSITEVRTAVRQRFHGHPLPAYLPEAGVVPLTPSTALVGHDGWGDSRSGNYVTSSVELNDHLYIKELTRLTRSTLQHQLMRLGDEAALYLRQTLPSACDRYPHVILRTHVPPFRESCWYQGQVSNDEWLPFFACQAVGEVLHETMRARPNCQLTVYCGHTHQRHGTGATKSHRFHWCGRGWDDTSKCRDRDQVNTKIVTTRSNSVEAAKTICCQKSGFGFCSDSLDG